MTGVSPPSLTEMPVEQWLSHAAEMRRQGNAQGAILVLEKALQRYPNGLELYGELFGLHGAAGDYAAALSVLQRAQSHCGGSTPLAYNMAWCCQQLGWYEEAEQRYRHVLARQADLLEAWNNLGLVLRDQGRYQEALAVWTAGLQHAPPLPASPPRTWNGPPDTRICMRRHRASIWLLLEDFEHGWPEYEWRFVGSDESPEPVAIPVWTGGPLAGKRLLVRAEQGIGDEIFFAGWIPYLMETGTEIVLECTPRLGPLFRRAWPDITVHAHDWKRDSLPGELLDRVDLQVPVGSLPGLLMQAWKGVSPASPYLMPEPALQAEWRARLAATGNGLKVGLSWRGGGDPVTIRRRSIPIETFSVLGGVADVQLIDIQYGSTETERVALEQAGLPLHHLEGADPLQDMDAFAAKLSALDLIVSVDNATAHLAGALGVKTFLTQPLLPEWRWGLERHDCLWYHSVRQFRALNNDEWVGVLWDLRNGLVAAEHDV
jgi:hypothetical protein